ncbi:MAG: glutathione S-transferase family protein [Pseudomonadota bacterium]
MRVYGSKVSYYTGKLEAYLRYKRIPYTLHGMPYDRARELKQKVGAVQMPIVDREDGRWMSDTTPILLALETEHPECPILPDDPVVAFIIRLVEDYGDEWLWRAAIHYRWSFPYGRELISNILVDELSTPVPLPRFIVRRLIRRRQIKFFTTRDGVTPQTRAHVELGYRNALQVMSKVLDQRPFVFGEQPSLADFGLMGPMFRHFSQDPEPAEIMRNTAPLVYQWVARMWTLTPNSSAGFIAAIDDILAPLLREVCETHLVQLAANAAAHTNNRRAFEMTVQGCHYDNMPVSRYRVYCLEELRNGFSELSDAHQTRVKQLLPYDGARALWDPGVTAISHFNVDRHLPYGPAINVYGDGTP